MRVKFGVLAYLLEQTVANNYSSAIWCPGPGPVLARGAQKRHVTNAICEHRVVLLPNFTAVFNCRRCSCIIDSDVVITASV